MITVTSIIFRVSVGILAIALAVGGLALIYWGVEQLEEIPTRCPVFYQWGLVAGAVVIILGWAWLLGTLILT